MLGRLARWLRLMGYDVAYERDIPDARLVSRSWKENRLILTRDSGLRRWTAQMVFVHSDRIEDQLRQVLRDCGLRRRPHRFYSRCSLCNTPLRSVPKAEIRDQVPAFTYRHHRRFARCPRCRKVYWLGSHAPLFRKDLRRGRGRQAN